jgi:hypothetical protein
MSLTCRVCPRLHSTAREMSEQRRRGVVGFSVALAGSRGLAAGIRGYTQAVYPRRSADRRLPVATYPLEYGYKLRGCAAYPREYEDRLWELAAHRHKSGDGPCIAVDCAVGRCMPSSSGSDGTKESVHVTASNAVLSGSNCRANKAISAHQRPAQRPGVHANAL